MICFVIVTEILLEKRRWVLSWRVCTAIIVLFVFFLPKSSYCLQSIYSNSKQWDGDWDWLGETCPKCAPKRSTEINLSSRGRWLYIKAEKNHTGSHGNTFKHENCGLPTEYALIAEECACVCLPESRRDREWRRENKRKGERKKGGKKESLKTRRCKSTVVV